MLVGSGFQDASGGARSVLVVIPTGWADSSNYNKKMARSKHENVTIQLIPYSEHSNVQELKEFVTYIRPREVVPTVFKDENQRRAIHDIFRNMVDSTAAKRLRKSCCAWRCDA